MMIENLRGIGLRLRAMATRSVKTKPTAPPREVLELLPQGKAAGLSKVLKAAMSSAAAFPLAQLLELARAAGWDLIELEKLAAYGEFFSGNSATAYQRVMNGRLAETDYDLFMTTCTHCYLFDRFEEGYALLAQFKQDQVKQLDQAEFLAFAGYITLAAGESIEAAIAYFDRALDLGLHSVSLAFNAYPIYLEAGRLDRVNQLRQLIHEHYAEDPEAIYALACVELGRDYYPEGFRLAEVRYRMPEVARAMNPSLLPKRRWQGEPLAGKRLLVHGEQGYGDIVMMARYLPLLTAQGANVIVDCQEAAIPLLAHNFPECVIVAGDLKTPIDAEFDLWTGVMSLPYHFNTTADSVPTTAGYLGVPPEQTQYWRMRVAELAAEKRPRIGLAWSGNPSHRADKRRSIAFESIARHVRQHPQFRFFSLQTSLPSLVPANLINTSEEMLTLADTAALIAEMDLVITVDTSIVHIAGAIGKTTWLLLPHRYEWRWGLTGEENNWYNSVQVLRQKTHGDWSGLLDDVFSHRLAGFAKQLAVEASGP